MSLVAGRGPLSKDPAGRFSSPLPDDLVFVEPHPRRVQAIRNGQVVIDTERALMVHRRDHPLSYAFPADAVGDLPSDPEPQAPGYVHVPWDAVDTWLEEGRTLVHYPPNPYHRVDCRPTNRGLRVTIAGATLVDTVDTVIVFETALDPRLYVNPSVVRTEMLRRTEIQQLLQLQGLRDVLGGGGRRHRRRRCGVDVRGPAARMPAHQRTFQLRRSPSRCARGAAGILTGAGLRLHGVTRVTNLP